jgi:hypothetical protein
MYKIELGLSFMVTDLVYKFQMICLKETEVIEWKPNAWCKDMSLSDILIKLKQNLMPFLETLLAAETWEWWINFIRQLDDCKVIFDRPAEILLALFTYINWSKCIGFRSVFQSDPKDLNFFYLFCQTDTFLFLLNRTSPSSKIQYLYAHSKRNK